MERSYFFISWNKINLTNAHSVISYLHKTLIWNNIFAENIVCEVTFLQNMKNKFYKCPICDVIFAINISLKDQISSEHEKNKSYKCPICDVIFAENISLKIIFHQNMRNKSYKCPIYHVWFSESIRLKGHISSEQKKTNLTNAQSVMWYLQ